MSKREKLIQEIKYTVEPCVRTYKNDCIRIDYIADLLIDNKKKQAQKILDAVYDPKVNFIEFIKEIIGE